MDRSAESANRLAHLLGDTRGAEVLAELQKLNRTKWSAARSAPPNTRERSEPDNREDLVGVWAPRSTPDGVALDRRSRPDWWRWADIEHVPPPGEARRVALVGESVARGWLLEPAFTPAKALARCLGRGHQVVDLARSNIDLDALRELVRAVPAAQPDVVVLYAGNNFAFAPLDGTYRDLLADAVRAGGYAEMRRVFVESVVLPEVDRLLDDVAQLARDHEVVIVVPETNLRGWRPAAGIEVPAMPPEALAHWYALRQEAEAARDEGRWGRVAEFATAMTEIDEGLSPASWYLRGRAAGEAGAGTPARSYLERARDATIGLLLDHVAGVITAVRDRLLSVADDLGVRSVDASAALASADLPELPDPRCFLDHIHLADEGIERVMSRVADAVQDLPEGTTPPGPGADPATRAVCRALAAGYSALRDQPADVVKYQLDLALEADEKAVREFVGTYLDVLEGPGIQWAHPALARLMDNPQTRQVCFQVTQTRDHSPGYWEFRRLAQETLGRAPARAWQRVDLLPRADTRGFRAPNFASGKAYAEATTERTQFHIALDRPEAGGVLRLTYRLREGTAEVTVNGNRVGELPASRDWTATSLAVPAAAARPGVNRLEIRWPVPRPDLRTVLEADASALARRTFPRILPVFGELFTAFFEPVGGAPDEPMASRANASAGWRAAPVPAGSPVG